MTDLPPARAPGVCCCVVEWKVKGLWAGGGILDCKAVTTGPDDPFCSTCTDRHPEDKDNPNVRIYARLPDRVGQ